MVKRITKFLVIIIISIMLLSPTVMGFEVQMWSKPGNFVTVNNNYAGLFCMNHGYRFIGGTYRVYEHGLVSNLTLKHDVPAGGDKARLLSFIIGDMQRALKYGEQAQSGARVPGINPASTRNGQEWQEAIWYYLGTNAQQPTAYASLVQKYEAYEKIYKQKDNEITIEAPNPDVVVANANGMIGPFTIKYPYEEKVGEYTDLKITMTDSTTGTSTELFNKTYKQVTTNKLKKDPEGNTEFKIGDTEFYFSVSEATYGKKYKFNIEWNFTYYNEAEYWKLTPPRTLIYYIQCDTCGDRIAAWVEEAFLDPNSGTYVNRSGNVVLDSSGNPIESMFSVYGVSGAGLVTKPSFSETKPILDTETGQPVSKDTYPTTMNTNWYEGSYMKEHHLLNGGWYKQRGKIVHDHIMDNATETHFETCDTFRASHVLFGDLKWSENGYGATYRNGVCVGQYFGTPSGYYNLRRR